MPAAKQLNDTIAIKRELGRGWNYLLALGNIGCANASAGLRVAVGTGRGADGRLRLGDVSWDYSSL